MGLFSVTAAKQTLNNALGIITPSDTPSADAQAQLAAPSSANNGVPTAAPADTAGVVHGVSPFNWKLILTVAIIGAVGYYVITRKGPVAAVVKAVK